MSQPSWRRLASLTMMLAAVVAVPVTAQSPSPSAAPASTRHPREPSADFWTLAHDAVGRAWLREFDGSTGAPVSTKGRDAKTLKRLAEVDDDPFVPVAP